MAVWLVIAIVAGAGAIGGMARSALPTNGSTIGLARVPLIGTLRIALVGYLLLAGVSVAAGLLAVSAGYGFHRDELYFIVAGRHPAFGYVDQPSFTPLVSAASVAIFGLSPTAIRILPALSVGAIVVIAGLLARELGGTARASLLAGVVVGLSGFLAAGHLDSTATYDVLAWSVVLWLLVKVLAGGDHRLWLAVGVAMGIGLENKNTVLFLGLGLVVGVLVTRRWDIMRSLWAWAAVAIALLLWAPNLAWQAANGFPQLTMAGRISGGSGENRAMYVPQLLLLAGPLLFPVSLAGLVWLSRSPAARPWRLLAVACIVVLIVVFATGGKSYYVAGFYGLVIAAGAIALDRWLDRGRMVLRRVAFGAAAVVSGSLAAVLVLPIVPVDALGSTPIPSVYKESAEQVGWPQLVATVEGVVAALPAEQRAGSVIITANYGEAGALQLLGSGVAPVYSGHNAYWAWAAPKDDRSVVLLVGWPATFRNRFFDSCQVRAVIDNGVGVRNQEEGTEVSVCTGHAPWSVLWPRLSHLD